MSNDNNWTGPKLAKDLAACRDEAKWLSWVEIPLGALQAHYGSIPRADVLAVSKSFVHPAFLIYEVKVSRSDYLADVNRGKYQVYLDYCNQLYFAAPTGVISKAEVPDTCGLILRGENGWHVVKAAPRREFTPDTELMLKLLMRGYDDHRANRYQIDRLKLLEYKGLKEASYQFGIQVARDLAGAEDIIKEAKAIEAQIAELLNLEPRSMFNAVSQLRRVVDSLLGQYHNAPEAIRLVQVVQSLFSGMSLWKGSTPRELRSIADVIERRVAEKSI